MESERGERGEENGEDKEKICRREIPEYGKIHKAREIVICCYEKGKKIVAREIVKERIIVNVKKRKA